MMVLFYQNCNRFLPAIFTKHSLVDVCQGSKYASEYNSNK